MRDGQMEMFGVAAMLGFSADTLKKLDRLYPNWRADMREILEELSTSDQCETKLQLLAQEALAEFVEWESLR